MRAVRHALIMYASDYHVFEISGQNAPVGACLLCGTPPADSPKRGWFNGVSLEEVLRAAHSRSSIRVCRPESVKILEVMTS